MKKTRHVVAAVASNGMLYMAGTASGHVFAINPATGAVVSRTTSSGARCSFSFPTNPLVNAALSNGRLWTENGCTTVNWYDVPFGPATGWSQSGGTAGWTQSRFVPR